MSQMDKPILEITTKIAPRQRVRIDGVLFRIRTAEDVALLPRREQHGQALIRLGALFKRRHPTPKEVRERHRLLRQVTAAIVEAPPTLLAKLPDVSCVAILQRFLAGAPTVTR